MGAKIEKQSCNSLRGQTFLPKLTKDLYLVREFLVCRPRFHFFQAGLGLLSTVVNHHFLQLKTRKCMTILACEKTTPDISQSLIKLIMEKKETHKLDQHTACQPHTACTEQHLFH